MKIFPKQFYPEAKVNRWYKLIFIILTMKIVLTSWKIEIIFHLQKYSYSSESDESIKSIDKYLETKRRYIS